jgi:hypothetical protein
MSAGLPRLDSSLGLDVGGKPYTASSMCRRVHELTNSGQDSQDCFIVIGQLLVESRFELRESTGQFFV